MWREWVNEWMNEWVWVYWIHCLSTWTVNTEQWCCTWWVVVRWLFLIVLFIILWMRMSECVSAYRISHIRRLSLQLCYSMLCALNFADYYYYYTLHSYPILSTTKCINWYTSTETYTTMGMGSLWLVCVLGCVWSSVHHLSRTHTHTRTTHLCVICYR